MTQLFKVGDLLNLGTSGMGQTMLVMPVVRVTKTMAICQFGDHIVRVNNSRGNVVGRGVFQLAKLWDGKATKPLHYGEMWGEMWERLK